MFAFLIRIPGWKNLTTVDKAIHINANERRNKKKERKRERESSWGGSEETLKKYFYVLLYALVRID